MALSTVAFRQRMKMNIRDFKTNENFIPPKMFNTINIR